ncbi:hypothetical protein [Noviherbaspirillum suwonense]|jgi:hypothetical protein|uniref:Rubrerythrin diiron-binding domain-containing protein n=1 Tax=Noviherbaspirillum suwonense TaxID=1224511 RepID=A0ABY1PRN4_9BURK|nr:hypothetical protein [Noviherbaspirillum suwonense]SMP42689.1 hypothetical protein SAMN06295970_101222 [Noviherbaspirillum suwonense]
MNSTDEAILTFAEAFARLGDRKHSELYLEALATIVRMAKAEERHAVQLGRIEDDGMALQSMQAIPSLRMH